MIILRFFCYSNNSKFYMLCIDNSHFFLLAFVIFANLYTQKSCHYSQIFHKQQQVSYHFSNSYIFLALSHNHSSPPASLFLSSPFSPFPTSIPFVTVFTFFSTITATSMLFSYHWITYPLGYISVPDLCKLASPVIKNSDIMYLTSNIKPTNPC